MPTQLLAALKYPFISRISFTRITSHGSLFCVRRICIKVVPASRWPPSRQVVSLVDGMHEVPVKKHSLYLDINRTAMRSGEGNQCYKKQELGIRNWSVPHAHQKNANKCSYCTVPELTWCNHNSLKISAPCCQINSSPETYRKNRPRADSKSKH